MRKLNHPIFSCVFQLDKLPQVPSHDAADRGYTYEDTILSRGYGETVESLNQPHYQAWHDEKGRMVMLACHNNDLADGWEEEDHSPEFFKNFSEPYSFPMGINIIFYAMTH